MRGRKPTLVVRVVRSGFVNEVGQSKVTGDSGGSIIKKRFSHGGEKEKKRNFLMSEKKGTVLLESRDPLPEGGAKKKQKK